QWRPQPPQRRSDPGYGLLTQGLPHRGRACPAVVHGDASVSADADQDGGRHRDRSAGQPPAPQTWGHQVRYVESRVAVAAGCVCGALAAGPRPAIRAGTLALWLVVALAAGLVGGWFASHRWGGPGGGGTLEDTRGTIVVQ